MPWECGTCGAVERRGSNREGGREAIRIWVACHHCGKPLCESDRILLVDDAFSDSDGPLSRQAYHCSECKRADHPRASALREQVSA